MSRTLERSMARREYEKFAKRWREEKRLAGLYGKSGYRRPSFSEWNAMHQRNLEMMRESTPADVVEHLGADPWAEQRPEPTPQEIHDGKDLPQERGVITLDIASPGDE